MRSTLAAVHGGIPAVPHPPLPATASTHSHTLRRPPPPRLTQVLPRFVEQRLGGLGASERASLLALFEQSDLDAHAFESRLRLYINDCIYFERSR